MKLEKFSKNKKQKRIIIGTIAVFILLIGGITLYRTFALYEEKKEFNVLRGRVPNFSNTDIKLAFTINGEPQSGTIFPNKNDGYAVESVVCENGVTAEWNSTLWGLVNIQNEKSTNIECKINFRNTVILFDYVSVGDYIAYTPSVTNYNIPTSVTGNSTTQSINPSELNLWRVIRKNSNNRKIEIVSENSSSVSINFYGRAGYTNLVNGLNTIAKQYETDGITSGSRHMGYYNQTLTCSSYNSGECATGDTGYTADTNLVQNAIGSLATQDIYMLASRSYAYIDNHYYYVRVVHTDEQIGSKFLTAGEGEFASGGTIRPIVILESDILATKGTYNNKNLWKVN